MFEYIVNVFNKVKDGYINKSNVDKNKNLFQNNQNLIKYLI
jgi:hypothetical protein